MVRERFGNIKCWRPSAGLMVAVLIAAGGVVFALLQSQVTLTGNSIQTQSTGLLVSQSDSNYSNSVAGYNFSGLIPGVQASQTEHFFLKNTGSSPLALKIGVSGTISNPSGVDLDKVRVILTPYSTTTFMPGTPQSFPLQTLVDAGAEGAPIDYPSPLPVGTKEEFNLQVSMDADAVSGSSASLSNLDLALTGVASN